MIKNICIHFTSNFGQLEEKQQSIHRIHFIHKVATFFVLPLDIIHIVNEIITQ